LKRGHILRVTIVGEENPAARWILRWLRDEKSDVQVFREWMRRAGFLLAVYTSRELYWRELKVKTPLGVETIEMEPERDPLIVGVLGASLPLVEGFSQLYPSAPIGLVAARRKEEKDNVRVELYYERLPEKIEGPSIIVDPMLATGLTVAGVSKVIAERGGRPIIIASVIASKPGISYISSIGIVDSIVTLALDPYLDEKFFIVPGLGDAGDRSLGVVPH